MLNGCDKLFIVIYACERALFKYDDYTIGPYTALSRVV